MASLSPDQRKALAKAAADHRWKRVTKEPEPTPETQTPPPFKRYLPTDEHRRKLSEAQKRRWAKQRKAAKQEAGA